MLLSYAINGKKQFIQSSMLRSLKDLQLIKLIMNSNPQLSRQEPMAYSYMKEMLRR